MALNIKLKKYQKKYDHSYCLGVYPTLELIQHQPEIILGIILHSKGQSNQGVQKIRQLSQQHNFEIINNDNLVDKLSTRDNTYAIAVFSKKIQTLDQAKNHLVLVNPSSLGNLGTIIRTMLGFEMTDLAVIEPAGDVFHPQVIRASMGALFQLRLNKFSNFADYRESHADHNLYMMMTDGKISLSELEFQLPYTIVFGDEAEGLSNQFQDYGPSVKIPQSQAIDSFNLAVSVGITLYQCYLNQL